MKNPKRVAPQAIIDNLAAIGDRRQREAQAHSVTRLFTDTTDAFEHAVEASLIDSNQARDLVDAFSLYQRHAQQQALAGRREQVAAADHLEVREMVIRIWNDVLSQKRPGRV